MGQTGLEHLHRLHDLSSRLVSEVQTLVKSCPSADCQHPFLRTWEGQIGEAEAKSNILSSMNEIDALVRGPKDFLENLAVQCEMLGSLQWLGEFQILACIPLRQEVPIKDVADLSNVPEKQLTQIIRLTARCGFLGEPKRGYVAHTPLSACFVAHPSHLDAAMFLAEYAAPAALKSALATQRCKDGHPTNETAFNLAARTKTTFAVAREQNPRLGRQWAAFLQHAAGVAEDHVVAEAMAKLNWSNISKAGGQVVEVGAYLAAKPLARLFPKLRFLVQLPCRPSSCEPSPCDARDASHPDQVVITSRMSGTPQSVTSAAVYVLHLPSSVPCHVLTELQVHLPALRMSSGVMLVMTTRFLPGLDEPMHEKQAAVAHARGLIMYQMTSEMEMDLSSLLQMIDTVRDSTGKMVLVHKLCSCSGTTVALMVKYQLAAAGSTG
ncbi:hypothetical protein E4U42_003885 [Claviceps africana]|uniref:O-methyltransferase domain-containing protein n=1 Tax=Claviceps africana TaxID=83212 RepID=A0A8K0NL74_9HYPO|nr:hypothetical protein E4U42_003885 [Claviceps africana]